MKKKEIHYLLATSEVLIPIQAVCSTYVAGTPAPQAGEECHDMPTTFRSPSFSQVQREMSICCMLLVYLVRLLTFEVLLAGVIIDSTYFWQRYFCWSYY